MTERDDVLQCLTQPLNSTIVDLHTIFIYANKQTYNQREHHHQLTTTQKKAQLILCISLSALLNVQNKDTGSIVHIKPPHCFQSRSSISYRSAG